MLWSSGRSVRAAALRARRRPNRSTTVSSNWKKRVCSVPRRKVNKAKLFLLLLTFGKLVDPVLFLKLKKARSQKVPSYVKTKTSLWCRRACARTKKTRKKEPSAPRLKTGRDPYRLNENLKTFLFSENENLGTWKTERCSSFSDFCKTLQQNFFRGNVQTFL